MNPPHRHSPTEPHSLFAAVPKAELHLHLEGSIAPDTVVELAARHGVKLTRAEVEARYAYPDFAGFLAAFKWVTSFLRDPADYALIAERLAGQLLAQNVVYAEVIVSAGVMLWRRQDVAKNFFAIREAASRAAKKGLRQQWVFDAVRQFGPGAAQEVARRAVEMKREGVVALGMGGDELALPAADFRAVYDDVAAEGLHRLVHAGEVGGPESVREAVELLGAERIGHGVAAIRDARTLELLAARRIPLEICLTSNLRTGALARQLGRTDAGLASHPLAEFVRRDLRVTLSTDDPAMFQTSLVAEYGHALEAGLTPAEVLRTAEMSFDCAFLPAKEKQALLDAFRSSTNASG